MPGQNILLPVIICPTNATWLSNLQRLKCLIVLLIVLTINSLAVANSVQHNASHFADCISRLYTEAREHGISEATIAQVLSKAKFMPRIIELDRRQPEFTQTFADYFNARVSEDRVRRGKTLLTKYHRLLDRIRQETGVSPQYLVAFWGLETNYGSYLGNTSVPSALATLACDQRRKIFFTSELLNALRIIDTEDISADHMVGSWAGAMGHMQFMPSTYLRYARDGDGDGRRDLWDSIPDALISAGFFLQQLGWSPEQHWGQEVKLPAAFNYALAGRNQSKSLTEWAALGVTAASGTSLPSTNQQASLLVPAGHKGPAFLVYENFNIILDWNRSEFYALTVGHLADRIAGSQVLHRSPPTDSLKLTRKQVRQLQLDLSTLNIDAGEIDGIFGPDTRSALSRFQQNTQRIADGYPDLEILNAIRNAATNKSRAQSTAD
jgi:peptidoglycan lytic transglycosylase B